MKKSSPTLTSIRKSFEAGSPLRSLDPEPGDHAAALRHVCLLNVDRRTKIPKDRMALYRIALETLARRETERETDWARCWS